MKSALKQFIRLTILTTAVLVLAGCGFQLRGSDGAPTTSLDSRYSITIQTAVAEFRVKLAESLRRRGFSLVNQDSDYRIELFDEIYNEDDFELVTDRLDLDIRTLNYRISFRLTGNSADSEIVSQTIAMSIDYTRYGANELARDTAALSALERVRKQVADLLADRLVALISVD